MKTKFQVGKLYYIKFNDHSTGIKDMMTIEAVGWCIKDAPKYAVFTAWQVLHDDREIVDNNHEPFSLIKSCVLKKRKLDYGS